MPQKKENYFTMFWLYLLTTCSNCLTQLSVKDVQDKKDTVFWLWSLAYVTTSTDLNNKEMSQEISVH